MHHKTFSLVWFFLYLRTLILMKAWIQKAMSTQIASGSALYSGSDCLRKHSLYIQYTTFMLTISEAFQSNTTNQFEYCDCSCISTD